MREAGILLAVFLALAAIGGGVAAKKIAQTDTSSTSTSSTVNNTITLVFDEDSKWSINEKQVGGTLYRFAEVTPDGLLVTTYGDFNIIAYARENVDIPEGYYVANWTIELRFKHTDSWSLLAGEELTATMLGSGTKLRIQIKFTYDTITGKPIVIIATGTGSAAIVHANPGDWIHVKIYPHYRTYKILVINEATNETSIGYSIRSTYTVPLFNGIFLSGALNGHVLLDYVKIMFDLEPLQIVTPGGG